MTSPKTLRRKIQLSGDQRGVSLVEVITTLIIVSLLAVFAAPEILNWKPRMNLKDQSEQLFANMQKAKIHALKNNVDVVFTFKTGATGGFYSFVDAVSGDSVAVCDLFDGDADGDVDDCPMTESVYLLSSTFVTGDGITARGLPIKGAERAVVVKHDRAGVKYKITLSVAGGVSIAKDES